MTHNVPPICYGCRYKHTLKEPHRSKCATSAYCPYRGKDITILTSSCRKKRPEHYSPNLFDV